MSVKSIFPGATTHDSYDYLKPLLKKNPENIIFHIGISSKKRRIRAQASREQADAQSRPQVSREMLPIHCHAWTCLSIIMLECTSPAKWFPPKTEKKRKEMPKRNSFLPNKYKKWIALLRRSTKQIWTLQKLANTEKPKTEQHFYSKDKNNQVHSQIKIHKEHLKNITKIDNHKKMKLQSIKEWTQDRWRQKKTDTLQN